MIRAFLFDIGNVLVRFDFMLAAREVAPFSDVADEADAARRIEDVKTGYENGDMSREDFLGEIFRTLGYRGTEAQFIAAWQGIFRPNEPMPALVRGLHGNFPLYLLSNTSDLHMEGLFRDFDVFQLFSGGTFSYRAKASKPDPAIYKIACEEHGLDPRSTFFIDDLAQNIATADEMGFLTHHYHHERHAGLSAALSKMGLTV